MPEALRLADVTRLSRHHEWHLQAAAELRRLHAENERLATEVADRNRRALAGDEAVFALSNVHAHYAKLEAQRDALLEALKLAWPIIEKEKFMQDGCYGKNFIQSKAERARKAYEAARAAIKAAEETK